MFKTLLRLYYQMTWNSVRYAPLNLQITYGISFLVIGIVVVIFSMAIAGAAATFPDELLSLVLSYLFAMMLGLVILIGVPQVFNDMYSSKELEHLFTLPIPTRHIFWIKYGQSFVAVPGFVWLVAIILITIYGIIAKASLIFYPISYLTLLAVIMVGMAIAYLLNLILVQIIPARRAKELMTVMSGLAGLLAYISFQIPTFFMDETGDSDLIVNLPQLPNWLPLTWGADAIAFAKVGKGQFVVPFVLIVILAIILMLLATLLVERGFRTGWVRLNEGAGRKKRRRRHRSKNKVSRQLLHPALMVGIKDWLTIRRDLREWITFLPIVFIMFFPLITIVTNKEVMEALINEPLVTWSIMQGLFVFSYTLLGSTFAASAIGREGESYYICRVLPINSWHFAIGKFWISLAIPLVVISLMEILLGLFLKWSLIQIGLGIIIIALYGMGVTGIGIAFGTYGSRFNRDNPQQRLKLGISFLLMIVTGIYMLIATFPMTLSFLPIEAILEGENLEVSSGGIFAVIVNWKINNQLLVKSIGILLFIILTSSVTFFTLLLAKIKIDKGLKIDIVSNVKKIRKR